MDYDLISNLSFNFTFDSDISPEESMSMILHEIIFSIICLAGAVADGIVIYIINRFKNMKTPTNTYVMNWLIGDAVYLLLTPCFYRIFSAFENFFVGEEVICISFELASILQITSIAFIIVLCANWFLNTFSVRTGKFHMLVICVVWALALSGIISFSSLCIRKHYTLFSHHTLFFSYAVLLFICISMHVTKYFTRHYHTHTQEKVKLNMTLVTAYVVCWLPSWLCLLLDNIIDNYYVLYYLSIVAACLGYLNAMVNVYVFVRVDKGFRMCFLQIFRYVHRDYRDVNQEFGDCDDNFNQVHVHDSSNVGIYNVYHE